MADWRDDPRNVTPRNLRRNPTPTPTRYQSLIEKLLRKVYGYVGPDGALPSLGALEAPMVGMVINSRNAVTIKKAINTISKSILKEWDAPKSISDQFKNIAEAIAYAKTKHPRLTGVVDKFNPTLRPINSETGVIGKYMPEINEVLISANSTQGPQTVQELVNTILHESRHALSNKRTPNIFKQAFNNLNDDILDLTSLEEQRAYQAGDTAEKAY